MYRQLRVSVSPLFVAILLGLPTAGAAQEPPPVMATIALEGTVDKVYGALNALIVNATTGVEHLFHLTGRTVVHGAKDAADAGSSGLSEGSRVVVHYITDGEQKTAVEVDRIDFDGFRRIEGVVTNVDSEGKKLSIRLGDGSTETLHVTEAAASEVRRDLDGAAESGARVIAYYTDEGAAKVVHYLKRSS